MRTVKYVILALLLLLALVACGGNTANNGGEEANNTANNTAENSTANNTNEETTDDEAAMNQVEVFSWWTGGGEAAGLEAMIVVFKAQNPDIEFVNAAVAGGAGTNARAVLATRLQANNPPDSWQGHAGQELIGTYVSADKLETLNSLYE